MSKITLRATDSDLLMWKRSVLQIYVPSIITLDAKIAPQGYFNHHNNCQPSLLRPLLSWMISECTALSYRGLQACLTVHVSTISLCHRPAETAYAQSLHAKLHQACGTALRTPCFNVVSSERLQLWGRHAFSRVANCFFSFHLTTVVNLQCSWLEYL